MTMPIYLPPPRRIIPVQLGHVPSGVFPGGTPPTPFPPPPDPPDPPPDPPDPLGLYGPGAGVTAGGTSVTDFVNADASDALSRLQDLLGPGTGQRHIEIIGNRDINLNRLALVCTRSNLTVQGRTWRGRFVRGSMTFRGSQLRLDEMSWLVGDDVVNPNDADGLCLNPGSGSGDFMYDILLYHLTGLGGSDVGGLTVLNGVRRLTVQECMWGLGLRLSRHEEATEDLDGHSKGWSFTRIGQAVNYPAEILAYRNFGTSASDRTPQVYNVDDFDYVNNADYNHGRFTMRVNPGKHGSTAHGMNVEGNMRKAGPETTHHFAIIMSGTNQHAPNPVANTVWLGGTSGIGNNLAIDMPGDAQDEELASGVRRTSRYGTIYVEPEAASEALFEEVVAGAGRTNADAFEQALKDHAIAGTSDGYYNGINGPSPELPI